MRGLTDRTDHQVRIFLQNGKKALTLGEDAVIITGSKIKQDSVSARPHPVAFAAVVNKFCLCVLWRYVFLCVGAFYWHLLLF